jgi:outer membrane protein OmpA-like peptidoglycan-associated protein
MSKRIDLRASVAAALALLAGCATTPQPQRYTGTLRQWFEGQSFTPDGQTESWFYGVNEEAARKLAAAFPEGYEPSLMGDAQRAEIMGVVTPVSEEARRAGSLAAPYAHYIAITDVISVHVIPNACETTDLVIYFDSNSADLTPAGRAQLDEVLGHLHRRLCNVASIRIVGATDTVGSAASNQSLSERRAAAVAALVEAHGFANDLIHSEGRGETQLMTPTADNVHEPLNRNAHITIESPAPG